MPPIDGGGLEAGARSLSARTCLAQLDLFSLPVSLTFLLRCYNQCVQESNLLISLSDDSRGKAVLLAKHQGTQLRKLAAYSNAGWMDGLGLSALHPVRQTPYICIYS